MPGLVTLTSLLALALVAGMTHGGDTPPDGAAAVVGAATAGDLAKLAALLDADPSLAGATDAKGNSVILLAIFGGQRAAAELVAARRASLDVFEAAALGKTDVVRERLAADRGFARAFAPDGFTALHYAAHLGHEDAARLLVEAGADLGAHSRNAINVTALESAVAGRQLAISRYLLEKGSAVNERQENGTTALHVAAAGGDAGLVRLLLEFGADRAARQAADGKTPAEVARQYGHPDVAELLDGR
jgi:ankyrin repeat protein